MRKLNDAGIDITRDDIIAQAGEGSIGRMHIAKAVHARGHCSSVQDVFDKYIGGGKRAYVRKPMIGIQRAIDLVHAANGLAFIAHPGIGSMPQLLESLLKFDFDGIEVYHVHHHPDQAAEFRRIAESRGLLITGGSDCHGTIKGHEPEMGKVRLPWDCYERIVSALGAGW